MRLSDHTVEGLLESWPVACLASVGADGRPHQVPVVFARVGEQLWSPVDGKPKVGGELVRVRNLRARPDVSLLLEEYTEDWTRLWWIRVDATATIVRPADPDADPSVASAIQALRRKYPQYGEVPVLSDPPTLISLLPVAVRSWCGEPRKR